MRGRLTPHHENSVVRPLLQGECHANSSRRGWLTQQPEYSLNFSFLQSAGRGCLERDGAPRPLLAWRSARRQGGSIAVSRPGTRGSMSGHRLPHLSAPDESREGERDPSRSRHRVCVNHLHQRGRGLDPCSLLTRRGQRRPELGWLPLGGIEVPVRQHARTFQIRVEEQYAVGKGPANTRWPCDVESTERRREMFLIPGGWPRIEDTLSSGTSSPSAIASATDVRAPPQRTARAPCRSRRGERSPRTGSLGCQVCPASSRRRAGFLLCPDPTGRPGTSSCRRQARTTSGCLEASQGVTAKPRARPTLTPRTAVARTPPVGLLERIVQEVAAPRSELWNVSPETGGLR